MAKAKKMTKAPVIEPEVETEEVEETPSGVRPKDLATELGISPKNLRAYLRRTFPRALEAKNTSWYLDEDTANKTREHFTASDDDESEATDED